MKEKVENKEIQQKLPLKICGYDIERESGKEKMEDCIRNLIISKQK